MSVFWGSVLSGSGTVGSVSVTSANGVSGVVANPTTAPAITFTLGAITPSSVAASGTVTASNLSGTNTGDQTITLTGNVTGSGTGSFATTIAAGAVTLAMQANMATASLVYRKTAGAGAPEVNTLATLKTDLGLTGTNSGDQTITLTGNVTGSGTGSFATTVASVPAAAMPALTGDVTTSAGAVATTITAAAVSLAKMANLAANSIIGNNTGSPATPLALTTLPTSVMPALTGDVTNSAGSLATAIAANAVTDAKLRQGAALTVIGRSANSTGNVADIAGANNQVLRVSGSVLGFGAVDVSTAQITGRLPFANLTQIAGLSVLGITGTVTADAAAITGTADQVMRVNTGGTALAFGTIATGGIAASAVTYAKIQNVAASSLLGNPTGSPAAPAEITLAGGLAFSGTTLTAAGALTPTSVASSGAITSSSATGGIGYATGAGGAVTQITSRTTGVTLSKPCGTITLFSAAGSATWATFTVTNTLIAATDTIEISQKSGANLYNVIVTAVAAGSFNVSVSAVSGTATEAPAFNFVQIKAVAA